MITGLYSLSADDSIADSPPTKSGTVSKPCHGPKHATNSLKGHYWVKQPKPSKEVTSELVTTNSSAYTKQHPFAVYLPVSSLTGRAFVFVPVEDVCPRPTLQALYPTTETPLSMSSGPVAPTGLHHSTSGKKRKRSPIEYWVRALELEFELTFFLLFHSLFRILNRNRNSQAFNPLLATASETDAAARGPESNTASKAGGLTWLCRPLSTVFYDLWNRSII